MANTAVGLSSAPSRHRAGLAVAAYLAYALVAVIGAVTGSLSISVAGTAVYFLVAVALYALFESADRRIAIVALPLAALGCVIQGVGIIEADTSLIRVALVFFGLFLIVLGYLATRSAFAPRWLGIWLALAGAGWCTFVLSGTPYPVQVVVMALGGLSEVALLIWLIVLAVRRS